MDLWEFKVGLVDRVSSRTARAITERSPVLKDRQTEMYLEDRQAGKGRP